MCQVLFSLVRDLSSLEFTFQFIFSPYCLRFHDFKPKISGDVRSLEDYLSVSYLNLTELI